MNPLDCSCVAHDALTCIARTHHTTRFNASIVFATSTNTERNGKCSCGCHRMSEAVWRQAYAAKKMREAVKR